MYGNDNTNDSKNQELTFLEDSYIGKRGTVKVRPWREKKMANELLAVAYDEVDKGKASRLRECGKFLSFKVFPDGSKKLDRMTSCRVRLCPLCTWRKSLVNFANNIEIVNYVEAQKPRGWLFATFTLKRCTGSDLSEQIDRVLYAYKKLLLNTRVKAAVKGAYRGLEITHDCEEFITAETMKRRGKYLKSLGLGVGDRNPTFDTYHVHIHAIFCVNVSYFTNSVYMNQAEWAEAWAQALGVDYEPVVDIKRIKPKEGSMSGSVGEVSKYATKSSDFLVPHDWDLTVDTVRLLDRVLANRRFISYSGELLKAQRALKLKDADDADLTHIKGEYADSNEPFKIVTYFWYTGYRQYGTKERG